MTPVKESKIKNICIFNFNKQVNLIYLIDLQLTLTFRVTTIQHTVCYTLFARVESIPVALASPPEKLVALLLFYVVIVLDNVSSARSIVWTQKT